MFQTIQNPRDSKNTSIFDFFRKLEKEFKFDCIVGALIGSHRINLINYDVYFRIKRSI